jgi:hypothetical protein
MWTEVGNTYTGGKKCGGIPGKAFGGKKYMEEKERNGKGKGHECSHIPRGVFLPHEKDDNDEQKDEILGLHTDGIRER